MGGSIPAILLNTPGTGEQAITSLDGYPMTKRGEGARALSAAAAAGVLGTLFGVVALTLLIPVVRTIILAVGAPEMFALSLLGVLAIGVLTSESVTRGILSGLLGIMLSTIGYDAITGALRYTGGSLLLYDGFSINAITLGLFAVGEMIYIYSRGRSISSNAGVSIGGGLAAQYVGIRKGIADTWRYRGHVARGGLIGSIVGLLPGMGGTVAMFFSYATAKQRSKNPGEFGKGSVEGVIAAESANNAKEGGSLIPTLAFGIPGGSAMAIFIGVLYIVGLPPGPQLMNEHLDSVYYMAWSLAVAGIVGSVLGMIIAPYVARLATVSPGVLAPLLIAFAIGGAIVDDRLAFGIYVVIGAGLVGYWLRLLKYSLAGITLGFLLGPVVERQLFISLSAYGPEFLLRPLTLVILALVLLLLFRPILARLFRRRSRVSLEV
jgi:TctA family transporter